MRLFALAIALTTFVAACGPSPEPSSPTSSAPTAETTASSASALPETWSDDLTKDQQIAIMKQRVMPVMKKAFQEHDASRYADFGCKTCHGPQLKNPHEYLPKLTLENGQLTAFAEHAEVSKFMAEKVSPDMAAAMGMKPYDPATHEGFGCAGCHAIDKKLSASGQRDSTRAAQRRSLQAPTELLADRAGR